MPEHRTETFDFVAVERYKLTTSRIVALCQRRALFGNTFVRTSNLSALRKSSLPLGP
jgi:hypothetical protein